VAKKSGKFEPVGSGADESTKAAETSAAPDTPTKRRRSRKVTTSPAKSEGFLQRYRGILIGAIAIVAVGFVGFVILQSTTASAYTCASLLPASPQSATEDAERLGVVVNEDGRTHSNSAIRYATCPPTSGDHRSDGVLQRQFYGAGSEQPPNNWVHNLEHGYAIIAYKGDPGAEVLDQIRGAMDGAAPSDVALQCGFPNKVIALRFDQMAEPFAVLAWDRALVLSSFDADLIQRAAEQFQDQPQAPERAC